MERLGDFDVLEVLGEGGSAVVYAARFREQEVALKVARELSTERAREKFLAEAERLARVDHPHVIKVLASGSLPDERPYLVMRRLHGETLAARIARGPIPRDEALALFDALADGVCALHDAGLVHRDIKAENVFLTDDGPVLLDLGIAHDVAAGPSTTTLDGAVRGTLATMAPERFFGSSANESSDVYELALLLYAMLAGRLPWTDSSTPERGSRSSYADTRLRPPSLTELGVAVSPSLSDAIMSALSTRPERRPESVRALAASIARAPNQTVTSRRTEDLPIRREEPPTSSAAPLRTDTPEPRRNGRGLWAVAAVALAVPAVWLLGRKPPPPGAGPTASASASAGAGASADADADADASAAPSASPLALAALSPPPPAPVPASPPPPPPPTGLTWCRKLADVQCQKDFVTYANGASMCAHAKKNVTTFESSPSTYWPAYDKACRDAYPQVEKNVKEQIDRVMHPPANLVPVGAPTTAPASMPHCTQIKEVYCDPDVVAVQGGDKLCQGARDNLAVWSKQPPEWRAVDEDRCQKDLPRAKAVAAQMKQLGLKDAGP